MKPIWRFRLFATLIVVCVGGLSTLNLVAEFKRPPPSPLPARGSKGPSADQVSAARSTSEIAPYRSDLKAEYAIALAGQALDAGNASKAPGNQAAQDAVRSTLAIGPHDSRMWLVLALLQARRNPHDPLIAESLKMSYFTGPNRAELIPARLDAVTLNDALNDADLKELARGDVRAILMQGPNQRQALINDYLRAAPLGKTFLEESSKMIDPKFSDALRSAY